MNDIKNEIEWLKGMYFSVEEYSTDDGYSKEEYHNEVIDTAIQALREKLKRENPKPLTLDELRQNNGEDMPLGIESESVWVELKKHERIGSISGEELKCNAFVLILEKHAEIRTSFGGRYIYFLSDYGKTWTAYWHKPIKSSN